MSNYRLTQSADADIEGIARYTLTAWGDNQADFYLKKLTNCFRKISEGKVLKKAYSLRHSDVFVTRCEYHYIFYLLPQNEKPIIFAVLHERMDLVSQVKARL